MDDLGAHWDGRWSCWCCWPLRFHKTLHVFVACFSLASCLLKTESALLKVVSATVAMNKHVAADTLTNRVTYNYDGSIATW